MVWTCKSPKNAVRVAFFSGIALKISLGIVSKAGRVRGGAAERVAPLSGTSSTTPLAASTLSVVCSSRPQEEAAINKALLKDRARIFIIFLRSYFLSFAPNAFLTAV